MRPYQLKSATKMINDVELPGYGIYFAGVLLRFVSVFNIRAAKDQVELANDLFDAQCRLMTDRAKREAAGTKAKEICGRLTQSRARLTQKTMIAANKARGLHN